MPFHERNGVRYYTFDVLDEAGVFHAVITRRGGVSPPPWESLNVGNTVGDDSQRVSENRRRAFEALGRSLDSLYDVWQVHGAEIVCAAAPRGPVGGHLQADGILSDCIGITIFMRFADCVPIFLYDPRREAVGLVHAGWQGTVEGAAFHAVRRMRECYGTRPQDILAAIGPSIGAHHYEVGPEVVAQVEGVFGEEASGLLQPSSGGEQDGRAYFDLWQANRLLLERAGVHTVEVAAICTACHLEDWYSHRGEGGRTGRFGAMIGL